MAKIIVVANQPETLPLLQPLSVQPVHASPASCRGTSFVFILHEGLRVDADMTVSGKEGREIIRTIQAAHPGLQFLAFGEGRYISSELSVSTAQELKSLSGCLTG